MAMTDERRPEPFAVIPFVVTDVEAGPIRTAAGTVVNETVTASYSHTSFTFEAPAGTWKINDKIEVEARRL